MNYREKIDYSSLSTYLDCPRKFLFQYIMHFRGNSKNIHFVFGSCWHYGLEVSYKKLMKQKLSTLDVTELSIEAFNKLWQLEGKEAFPDEDIIFPKSPGHAANMYYAYWKRYLKHDLKDKQIIAVESPFVIELSNFHKDLPNYIGRIDLIFELLKKDLEIVDHKTAKALYPTALTGYEMSYQTDGYLTAGHLFYDKLPKMTYNVAMCQKKGIFFHRYYINKRKMQIEQFLQDIIFYSTEIIDNLNLLDKDLINAKSRHDHIKSFPRRPGNACTTFMNPCKYFNLCKLRNNPLDWMKKPPQGFSINEWNPETHEEEIKDKLKEIK